MFTQPDSPGGHTSHLHKPPCTLTLRPHPHLNQTPSTLSLQWHPGSPCGLAPHLTQTYSTLTWQPDSTDTKITLRPHSSLTQSSLYPRPPLTPRLALRPHSSPTQSSLYPSPSTDTQAHLAASLLTYTILPLPSPSLTQAHPAASFFFNIL